MGCDIHLVLEKHDTQRDRWVGVRSYKYFEASLLTGVKTDYSWVNFRLKSRNYELFNDLCGVRGSGSSFGYEPRGLPEDASDLTLLELGDTDDLHSHSWLDMAELRPVLNKHFAPELVKDKITQNGESDPIMRFVDNDIGSDEYSAEGLYRLVFAFDN